MTNLKDKFILLIKEEKRHIYKFNCPQCLKVITSLYYAQIVENVKWHALTHEAKEESA